MKKLWILVACTVIAGCGGGKVDVDERGVFRTTEFYRSEDKIQVFFVSGAPNSGFGDSRSFKIDASETPGGISDFRDDELLDCRVVIRIDSFKDTKKEPEITDCKRVDG